MSSTTPSSTIGPHMEPSIPSIGERIRLEGSEDEFVVMNSDKETGRMELLRLKPFARIEKYITH